LRVGCDPEPGQQLQSLIRTIETQLERGQEGKDVDTLRLCIEALRNAARLTPALADGKRWASLRHENEMLKSALAASKRESDEARCELQRCGDRLRTLEASARERKAAERQNAHARQQLEQQLRAANLAIKELEREQSVRVTEVESAKKSIDRQMESVRANLELLAGQKRSLEVAHAELAEQCGRLERQVQSAEERSSRATRERDRAEERIKKAGVELREMAEQHSAAVRRATAAERRAAELQARMDTAAEQLRQLGVTADAAEPLSWANAPETFSGNAADPAAAVLALRARLATKISDLKTSEQARRMAEERVETLRAEVQKLREEKVRTTEHLRTVQTRQQEFEIQVDKFAHMLRLSEEGTGHALKLAERRIRELEAELDATRKPVASGPALAAASPLARTNSPRGADSTSSDLVTHLPSRAATSARDLKASNPAATTVWLDDDRSFGGRVFRVRVTEGPSHWRVEFRDSKTQQVSAQDIAASVVADTVRGRVRENDRVSWAEALLSLAEFPAPA
jgi:chromosome segregation ATPase